MEPEDHYLLPKNPPLVPMVNKINLIHVLQSCFFKLHSIIALSSSPKSFNLYLSFMFPDQNPSCISRVLHVFQLISPTEIFKGAFFSVLSVC